MKRFIGFSHLSFIFNDFRPQPEKKKNQIGEIA
jgi:hypothetical protein